jgi:RNA-directed DNA polymerase
LFGGARKRDISRLVPVATPGVDGANEAGAGPAEEWVDVSGGPIKEKHRRRALRDKRLLPKVKSPARQLRLTKRKNVMSAAEAGRLFGATMQTRNRQLRNLLADPEQLRRYDLPAWNSEDELAAALGISLKELWFFSIHRERERQPHYITGTPSDARRGAPAESAKQ